MPYFEDIRMDIDDPELIEIHRKFTRYLKFPDASMAYGLIRSDSQPIYDEHNQRIQNDPAYVHTAKYRVIERCLVRYWRNKDELWEMRKAEKRSGRALNEERKKYSDKISEIQNRLNTLQAEHNALIDDYNNLVDQCNNMAQSNQSIMQSAQNNLSPLMRWVVSQRASSDLMEYGLTGKLPNRG